MSANNQLSVLFLHSAFICPGKMQSNLAQIQSNTIHFRLWASSAGFFVLFSMYIFRASFVFHMTQEKSFFFGARSFAIRHSPFAYRLRVPFWLCGRAPFPFICSSFDSSLRWSLRNAVSKFHSVQCISNVICTQLWTSHNVKREMTIFVF